MRGRRLSENTRMLVYMYRNCSILTLSRILAARSASFCSIAHLCLSTHTGTPRAKVRNGTGYYALFGSFCTDWYIAIVPSRPGSAYTRHTPRWTARITRINWIRTQLIVIMYTADTGCTRHGWTDCVLVDESSFDRRINSLEQSNTSSSLADLVMTTHGGEYLQSSQLSFQAWQPK